jgi:hypothetical protein
MLIALKVALAWDFLLFFCRDQTYRGQFNPLTAENFLAEFFCENWIKYTGLGVNHGLKHFFSLYRPLRLIEAYV